MNLKLFRKIISIIIKIANPFYYIYGISASILLIYTYIICDRTCDLFSISEFADPLPIVRRVNESDPTNCYKNFVFNETNEHLKFKDILDDDVLQQSDGRNIFFHLTNCIYDGIPEINPRQACAVESAARINSHLNIFLTFSAPVGFLNTSNLPLIDALMAYPNVHIRNLDNIRYAQNTPIEEWAKTGVFYKSNHLKAHVSDFLRLISLYKYGGLYLDLDTVMIKNISALGSNYAGPESKSTVANGIMHMDPKTNIGRKVAEGCLNLIRDKYNPFKWSANGPGAITSILGNICGTTTTKDMSREICDGFMIYHMSYFFGIEWWFHKDAFSTDMKNVNKILNIVMRENTTLVHLNNNLSHDIVIQVDDPTGYSTIASMYCPKVFHSCGKYF